MSEEEYIYELVTKEDEEAKQQWIDKVIAAFILLYLLEKQRFALEKKVKGVEDDEDVITKYALYLNRLLLSFLDRMTLLTKENARREALHQITTNWERFYRTEKQDAVLSAQLSVAQFYEQVKGYTVKKTWKSQNDALVCEVCRAMNGTTLALDEPFLYNGQVVELASGKLFQYNYKDRYVPIAHPNDRCTIIFTIEQE
ncbi:hypothetical protein FACS189418_6820 [Clostridia bacterium]|nr:hypothetical protein FACS189418_6820 [Clostridia bacterium]